MASTQIPSDIQAIDHSIAVRVNIRDATPTDAWLRLVGVLITLVKAVGRSVTKEKASTGE
jgi:hypothetical protein